MQVNSLCFMLLYTGWCSQVRDLPILNGHLYRRQLVSLANMSLNVFYFLIGQCFQLALGLSYRQSNERNQPHCASVTSVKDMLDKLVHYHPWKSSQIQKKLPGWQPFAILYIFIILAKQTVCVWSIYRKNYI